MSGDRAAAAPHGPKPGEVLAGKYRIERELGHGGMGVVYAATHLVTERRVAIKWMLSGGDDATKTERFLREARAAGRIDHPNVVQVLDVGGDERGPFIVMEFLNGEPLSSLLSRVRPSPAEAIDLLLPALRGVHAAHQEGVVHRDLKPDNIFLCRTRDGAPLEAKVLDFGISKLSFDEQPVTTLTRPGSLVGTPHYMAPERVRGHFDSDPRTDVYSFGVILYQVLTGTLPFDSTHVGDLIVRITAGNPTPPRAIQANIPPGLEAVVLRAMARRIEERYENIEALALALEPFATDQRFRVQRRDHPTGHHVLERATSESPTLIDAPPVAPTPLDRLTTGPEFRTGKRARIAAVAFASLIVAGAIAYGVFGGEESSDVHASARAELDPPAKPASAAYPVARPVEPAVESDTAPVGQTAEQTAARPREGANERPRATAPRAPARTPRTAKPAPKRGSPRVVRGVRTRGLSEQEF